MTTALCASPDVDSVSFPLLAAASLSGVSHSSIRMVSIETNASLLSTPDQKRNCLLDNAALRLVKIRPGCCIQDFSRSTDGATALRVDSLYKPFTRRTVLAYLAEFDRSWLLGKWPLEMGFLRTGFGGHGLCWP